MAVVVRNVRRADRAATDALGGHGVATIHEAQGRTGLLAPYLHPIWAGARIAGTAVTVSVPPADNWMIHVAVEQCQDGDVLVVAPTSRSEAGYVVVPRRNATEVLAASRAREHSEAANRARYQAGELSLDVHRMRGRLQQKGLEYVDQAADD